MWQKYVSRAMDDKSLNVDFPRDLLRTNTAGGGGTQFRYVRRCVIRPSFIHYIMSFRFLITLVYIPKPRAVNTSCRCGAVYAVYKVYTVGGIWSSQAIISIGRKWKDFAPCNLRTTNQHYPWRQPNSYSCIQ